MPKDEETPAIMRATYADIKVIRTRKVAQMILEFPIEQLETFVRLFGGPSPDSEKWVVVARLVDQAKLSKVERSRADYDAKTDGGKAVARAALLCRDNQFQNWLDLRTNSKYTDRPFSEEGTVQTLHQVLQITSRSQIGQDSEALKRFLDLEEEFKAATGRSAEMH